MLTAADIIDRLGGLSKVSQETGFPITTVHSWTRSNSIPHWRRDALLELAARTGTELTAEQFPDASARSANQDAAA